MTPPSQQSRTSLASTKKPGGSIVARTWWMVTLLVTMMITTPGPGFHRAAVTSFLSPNRPAAMSTGRSRTDGTAAAEGVRETPAAWIRLESSRSPTDGGNSRMERLGEEREEKLEATIDELEATIDRLEAEIDELKVRSETARDFFAVLESPSYSSDMLQKELVNIPWLYQAVTRKGATSENRKGLEAFIDKLEQQIDKLEQQIDKKRQERRELLALYVRATDTIKTVIAEPGRGESGLEYVRTPHQIRLPMSESFGLVVKVKNTLQVRPAADMEVAYFDELHDAWPLVQESEALSSCDQLLEKLPSLDATFLNNAWALMSQIQFQLVLSNKLSEITFQNACLQPFFHASHGCGWRLQFSKVPSRSGCIVFAFSPVQGGRG
jgi:prefoldin subunit 5